MTYSIGYNNQHDRFDIHSAKCSQKIEGSVSVTAYSTLQELIEGEVKVLVAQGQEFTAQDFKLHSCLHPKVALN